VFIWIEVVVLTKFPFSSYKLKVRVIGYSLDVKFIDKFCWVPLLVKGREGFRIMFEIIGSIPQSPPHS